MSWKRRICSKSPYIIRVYQSAFCHANTTDLDVLEKKYNIDTAKDWQDILQNNNEALLTQYPGLISHLQATYPEYKWKFNDATPQDHQKPAEVCKQNKTFISMENQRVFFDQFSKKHNINNPTEWKRVTYKQVVEEGGACILKHYSSLYEALCTIYPEISWDVTSSRAQAPHKYWTSLQNQRNFLDKVKTKYNITKPSDWSAITYKMIESEGGKSLFRQYSSLYVALKTVYPEHNWNLITSKIKVHRSFWTHLENQREFFDSFAAIHGIEHPSDWSAVTKKLIEREGGRPILKQYPSLHSALLSVYPEHEEIFNDSKFRMPLLHWQDMKNQRQFFDNFAKKNGITHPSDWKHVTQKQVIQQGGSLILQQYPSLISALEAIYPEYEWNVTVSRARIPQKHWNDKENQRKFFDSFAANHNITVPSDWSHITYTQVINAGGRPILQRYDSLFSALKALYPEYDWDINTTRIQAPKNHWNDLENVKEFIKRFEETHSITHHEDWYRISIKQIERDGGGRLMKIYNSIYEILRAVYPDQKWDKKSFQSRSKRSAQRWMFLQVQKAFPDCEVVEEYLHEDLSRKSGRAIELDVFVPARQIAFEYQGEHHFQDSPGIGSGFIELHQQRDNEKAELCKQQGIQLVTVPYWWDKSLESLQDLMNTAA